jgi:hypothetical protein
MNEIVAAFCDGGVIRRNPSELGGTWAWCMVGPDNEILQSDSGVIPAGEYGLPEITNNVSELVALLRLLYHLPAGWSGPVYSDSQNSLGRVFHGYKCKFVPQVLIDRIRPATERLGKIEPILLDGHPTRAQLAAGIGKRGHRCSEWNVWCDKRCGEESINFLAERERKRLREGTTALCPATS